MKLYLISKKGADLILVKVRDDNTIISHSVIKAFDHKVWGWLISHSWTSIVNAIEKDTAWSYTEIPLTQGE